MAEAERDIELLIDGKNIEPNRKANAAYKQRFVNYMQDHQEDIDEITFQRMVLYVQSLASVITANTVRQANEAIAEEQKGLAENGESAGQLRPPGPAQPLQDVIQQNVQR